MLIWRGYGAVVPGVVIVSALAANLIANVEGGPNYWDAHGWPLAASFLVDAGVLWLIDDALSKTPPRVLIDESTKERVEINKRHDFFFLRIRWWALLLAVLGLWISHSGWSPGPG
jgi:hypothetical protein